MTNIEGKGVKSVRTKKLIMKKSKPLVYIRRAVFVVAVMVSMVTEAADVPDMFIDCVKSPEGTQWVDTGIVPVSGTKVELDFAYLNADPASTEAVAGAIAGANKEVRPCGYTYGVRAYVANGGSGRYSGSTTFLGALGRYKTETVFKSQNCSYVENGQTLNRPVADDEWNTYFYNGYDIPDFGSVTLYLFAENSDGTAVNKAKIALYGAKIWIEENDVWVLKRDYRPCVKNGTAGLYDAVSETIAYSGSSDALASSTRVVYSETTNGVTPGQQIINAVNASAAGDTILFMPGTYTFAADEYTDQGTTDKTRIRVNVAGLRFVAANETPRTTWTEGDEPVIINVNGGRFAKIDKAGAFFSGLTFTGAQQVDAWTGYNAGVLGNHGTHHSTASNCVFRGNSAWRGGACNGGNYYDCLFKNNVSKVSTGSSSGGALMDVATVKNCVFIGNHSCAAAAIDGVVLLENCVFTNNYGTFDNYACAAVCINGGTPVIRDCTFTANTNNATKLGGTVRYRISDYDAAVANNYRLEITNCTFAGNVSIAASGWSYGGAVRVQLGSESQVDARMRRFVVCMDCTFEENAATFGGALYGVTAKHCTFRGNYSLHTGQSYFYGCDAVNCDLFDCDLDGGEIAQSVLTRCTIHDVTNRAVFYNYAPMPIFATNCLIRNCRPAQSMVHNVQTGAFVNCTFVHNKTGANKKFYGGSGLTTNINCLYVDNTNAAGAVCSVDVEPSTAGPIQFLSCAFGPDKQADLQEDEFCLDFVSPYFAGTSSYMEKFPKTAFYTPTRSSPFYGKGQVLNWTEADLDLAGNLRVREGMVDIGCYQCWLKPEGAVIILR